jgi:excisionase family DNA binding protein
MRDLSNTGLAARQVFRRGRANICDRRRFLVVRHKECLRSGEGIFALGAGPSGGSMITSLSINEAGVPNSGGYINKKQAAKWLAVSQRTLDTYMRRGLVVYYKIGRTVRFKLADLDEHLRKTCRIAGRGENPS